jgi:PAS domain S-box-containing protein
MSEEIRKTGIDIIGNAAWGTHFCQFYKTKKDLIDILIPYFKAGLENNEFCLWVTSKPLIEKDAAKALRKVLPDLDSYLKKGQIEIIPHDKWYLKEGVFNSKRVLRGWLRKLDKALSKGYDGLRLTGNTFWLEKKDWRNFADYEKEVDSVIGKYKIIALCTYSLDKCKANEVIDVVQNHQFALIKREGRWEIVESSECKRTEDEIKHFASFPQLNPNPVLEVDSSGKIIFCNDAAIRTLRELNLGDANVFLPRDMTSILNALEQKKEVQFYREITVSDRIFGEVLHLAIQFNSVRIYANDITERKRYQEAMKNALAESRQREAEISALLEGSRAVLKYHDFKSAARSIFDSCKNLIGATSGYIALLSEDGTENEVLFLDSGGLPCTVDPGLPMPIRGLRGEAYNNVKTVYDNDFHRSEWMKFIPEGHVRLENVLFAPMVVEGKAVGLLGIANKPRGFTENDARMASAFAELAAIALTQKRAEEALRHSEEYFRLVTENASDVITILDANGTIRYESHSVEQLLGYKQEELIGKSAFELIHPDDLSEVMDAFSQVTQKPSITLSAEFRCWHKDESWRTLEITGKNLLGNPAVTGIVINSRDVTERKMAAEALRREREKLINILDSMEDGVYIVNQQYDIEYINPLLERKYGPVNGRKCYEYFHDRNEVCPWCKNEDVFDGKTVRWEWFSTKTGKTYDLVDTPLRNPDGSVSKLEIFRDITERKKMEEALRESREDLNRAQAVAQTGSWRLDVRRNELLWSDENHRIFGIPKDTPMTYETFLGTVHPDDREYVDQNWMAALQGEHYDIEHRIVVNGHVKWARERAELEFGQDGSLRGGFGTTQDITERKNAEEALRKSEARYRSYLEVTGQVGWTTDANGLVVEDMPAWRQYTGQSREEIQVWGWSKVLHPDDLERTSEVWRKAVQEKRNYETEYRLRRHDGVYRHFLARGVPTFNEDGSIREWVGTCIDITERKQMEELLRKSRDELELRVQERTEELTKAYEGLKFEMGQREMAEKTIREQADILDSLFKDTITPLVLLDKDFNFIRVNGAYAKCCARDVSEFKGHNHFEFYPHEENEAIFRNVVETKVPFQIFAKPFVFPDHPEWGITYWDWTLTPLLDAHGEVTFLVFALNDVTERVKAEKEVEKNEALLRTVLETLPVGVWITDEKGNIVLGNPAGQQIWGGAQYVGMEQYGQYKGWWLDTGELIKPDEWSAARAIMKGETSLDEEIEIESFDGKHKIILSSTVPIRDPNGEIRGAVVVNRNITERKRMEDRIRATNNLLSLFVTKPTRKEYLDSVIDLIHQWTDCNCIGIRILDKQGNIPYESYTGFSQEFWEAENWISVKNHQCACTRVVLQKPDSQDMSMMTTNGSFRCDNTEEFAGSLTEKELARYRGVCILTGFKSVAIIPIHYKENIVGALHIADRREGMVPMEKIEFIESVTPLIGEAIFRFSAEEALEASEERYRMLIETMNEGLGVDDENGLLVYANDRLCEMLGYSRDEIIGRPVLSFLDEKNQTIIKEQTEKRKTGETESYKLEWIKKDGQKMMTMISPRPIFDTTGEYRGSFAVVTDVTEKLRLESIAQAVNTMNNIGFIFSGIRHEVGNPVNSIKMALSVLKQNIDSFSKDTVKEYADRMLSEIVRMEYLLKAMKNFNMYETLELMDVNMTSFMDKFLSLVMNDFWKKGIRVATDIPETLWAYADPRALQQILLNVMTNASDALEGREDPTIKISVLKMGGMVNIRVEDNGCGMSEEQQEDLFKPFYTTKAKGTGLGLVITKKMMTKMKGLVEVVSEKNKGTIVDLFIPEGINEES